MNAQELKDFQERDRQEKDRQVKEEQQKKEQYEKAEKAKEDYRKQQEKAGQKRYEDMTKKHESGTKAQEEQRRKEEKQLKKAMKPHSDLGKAREKLRKSPEHEAMRKAIKEQVADRQQTAKEGAAGPHVVRDAAQQAEAAKYSQMQNEDRKMALGEAGKGHNAPEMQGLRGGREMEAEQAKAAYQAAGEQKPWAKHAEKQQEQKAAAHEKGNDRGDGPQPDAVRDDRNGPDRPGPAPTHAHHGHGHMPWDKNPGQEHGGHGHHLSKENGQELAQGKPWEHRGADPDRAESRMAEQARERERDDQRR